MQARSRIDQTTSGMLSFDSRALSVGLARLVANVVSPPVVVVLTITLVAAEESNWAAWAWATLFVLAAVVPPLGYVVVQARRGSITDIHLPVREQRIVPFLVTLAFAGLGLLLLIVGGAPRLLLVAAAAGWLQAAALFVVTLRWKVSTHCAAIAGFSVLATALLGPLGLASAPAVLLVAWSRVRLRRHDVAQAVGGTLLGAAATAAVVLFIQG